MKKWVKMSFSDNGVNRKVVVIDENNLSTRFQYDESMKDESNDAFSRKWPKTAFFEKLLIKKI